MTTTDTASKFRYEGNGVTDTFAFSGRVFATSDIIVDIITRATDALVETLTESTHYTVTIATDGTASVQVTSAPKIPSVTQDILLRRSIPQSQSLSLPTGTPFPAKNVETALDKVTALVQDLEEVVNRSIKLPAQTSATAGVTVEPEDDKILAWDGTTGLLKNGPTTAAFTTATNTAVTAAVTATTQAGIATTKAGEASDDAGDAALSVTYASEWAINPEDDPVSVAAGGDNLTTFSALHWAAKAEEFADSVNLPALGAAHTVLQVNTAGDGLEYALLDVNNLKAGFINDATAGTIDTADYVLFADNNDSNATKKDTVANLLALSAGGGWVPIKTVTASNVATVDFVNGSAGVVLDGTYKAYAVVITSYVPVTDDTNFTMRTSANAGVSFDSGASDYTTAVEYQNGSSTVSGTYQTTTGIELNVAFGAGNAAGESQNYVIFIFDPANTSCQTLIEFRQCSSNISTALARMVGAAKRNSAAAVDGIRFSSSTNNISSAVFTMYGLANA